MGFPKEYREHPTAQKLYIWGMRRVGNHAITEWIAQHFGKTIHNNDIQYEKPWYVREYGEGDIIDLQIDSFEDLAPPITEKPGRGSYLPGKDTIFLLRDWYNVCASRSISGRGFQNSCRYPGNSEYIRPCDEVYLEYCKLWEKYPDNFILYNKWATDENYEIEIEERYGWKRSPRINEMPKSGIGGGSSFNVELNTEAVNERYLNIKWRNSHEWKLIIGNDEINSYNESIFGMNGKEL